MNTKFGALEAYLQLFFMLVKGEYVFQGPLYYIQEKLLATNSERQKQMVR